MRLDPIKLSAEKYEARLRAWLGGELVVKDLALKHDFMRQTPFRFLRATCWRWAERAGALCPTLATAPRVLAIGDCHIENFGVWRDGENRLVWGANDFDEAAKTPYAFDLVRLAASALLAIEKLNAHDVAALLLEGYRHGLSAPEPFVLENKHAWLREAVSATKAQRGEFWAKLAEAPSARPTPRFRAALGAAMPKDATKTRFTRRTAGGGSLGRPRFVLVGAVRGGPFAREGKATVPSCWAPRQTERADILRLARGPNRAPDPLLSLREGVLVRRLSPNSRKLDFMDQRAPRKLLLIAMGKEVANIHGADRESARAILADLKKRPREWLAEAAQTVEAATEHDWRAFRT